MEDMTVPMTPGIYSTANPLPRQAMARRKRVAINAVAARRRIQLLFGEEMSSAFTPTPNIIGSAAGFSSCFFCSPVAA